MDPQGSDDGVPLVTAADETFYRGVSLATWIKNSGLKHDDMVAILRWPWKPFLSPRESTVREWEKLRTLGGIYPQYFRYVDCKDDQAVSERANYLAKQLLVEGHVGTINMASNILPIIEVFRQAVPSWNLQAPAWAKVHDLLLQECGVDPLKIGELDLLEIARCLQAKQVRGSRAGAVATPDFDPRASSQAGSPSRYSFTRSGTIWTLRFGEETAQFNDSRGLNYLYAILHDPRPERGLTVAEMENVDPATIPDTRGQKEGRIDKEATKQYHEQLADLEKDIAAAEENDDVAKVESLREEKDALLAELTQLFGQIQKKTTESDSPAKTSPIRFGRKMRDLGPMAGHQKKANAIRKALSRTYDRLRDGGMTAMANHFKSFVKLNDCLFSYDPSPRIEWVT